MMDFATFQTMLQNGGHLAEIVIAFMFVRLDRRIVSIEKDLRHVENDLREHKRSDIVARALRVKE